MKKQKVDWKIVCTGLVCITVAESIALMNGINGSLFSLYALIIGGAIGVFIENPMKK